MNPIWCPHPLEERGPIDDHGYALCRLCLAAVPVTLTEYQLRKAFDAMWQRGRR